MDRKEFIKAMLTLLVDYTTIKGANMEHGIEKYTDRINHVVDVEIEGLLKVERIDD